MGPHPRRRRQEFDQGTGRPPPVEPTPPQPTQGRPVRSRRPAKYPPLSSARIADFASRLRPHAMDRRDGRREGARKGIQMSNEKAAETLYYGVATPPKGPNKGIMYSLASWDHPEWIRRVWEDPHTHEITTVAYNLPAAEEEARMQAEIARQRRLNGF